MDLFVEVDDLAESAQDEVSSAMVAGVVAWPCCQFQVKQPWNSSLELLAEGNRPAVRSGCSSLIGLPALVP